jgi:hypothetical protein
VLDGGMLLPASDLTGIGNFVLSALKLEDRLQERFEKGDDKKETFDVCRGFGIDR